MKSKLSEELVELSKYTTAAKAARYNNVLSIEIRNAGRLMADREAGSIMAALSEAIEDRDPMTLSQENERSKQLQRVVLRSREYCATTSRCIMSEDA